MNVQFENRSDEACELRLRFIDEVGDTRPTVEVGPSTVEFRPRESSGVLRRDLDPGVFLLGVPGNQSARAEIDALVISEGIVPAGEHQADLRLEVLEGDGTAAAAQLPLRLILQSMPRAQVNIAGSAGAFGSGSSVETVDFGVAESGATKRVFVQVRANAESTLSVRSAHRGVMRHVEMGEAGTEVAYQLELDGEPVDLTRDWMRLVDPPRTLAGVSLPLDFTLGPIQGQMSGRYEDLLTIDVWPN
ncbi:hypothetical protein Q0812_09375 [Brevundimonas sp. 2R-24]|uniref:Uncharacterized protein n=1 Tax=Peiella sedimenti TaxID=3061083 RepID=A0ABT8SM48_9CAUL|nr:hypothetical protein [Caulobacteraceae bacterium XZ-24]